MKANIFLHADCMNTPNWYETTLSNSRINPALAKKGQFNNLPPCKCVNGAFVAQKI